MGLLTELLIPETIVGYVLLCFVAAFAGRKRVIGFWGFFFLSILVTPLVTMFFLFVATPVQPPRPSKPRVKAGA